MDVPYTFVTMKALCCMHHCNNNILIFYKEGKTALDILQSKGGAELTTLLTNILRWYNRIYVLWMISCSNHETNILFVLPVDLARHVSHFL